ncbi:NUDIX hydrolase [Glutamicibacter endophyticus]|uniref:NUDIX hydrolase n=1 Tax=Glutamicibacter endophyticus TaxID=1522174 RepID=UPI003AEF8BBE
MAADTNSPAHARVISLQRSSDPQEVRLGLFDVVAAGAIPWKVVDGELRVLLIHRPRYDDWSWPKGKLDDGESVAECAVREVYEEVGLSVHLGLPLSATAYSVKGKAKIVYYWAAKVADGVTAQPDGGECDKVRWVSGSKALKLLTNASDRQPLEDLMKAHKKGRLDTLAHIILRHAKAKPRGNWTREEGERPLAATGRRQAQAVSRLLSAWMPQRVYSSPWTRCLQTITPYAAKYSLKPKKLRSMTEYAASLKPHKAQAVLGKILAREQSSLLCTHRPVLPLLLEVLSGSMDKSVAEVLPDEDPYLEPGGLIVVHQARGNGGKLLSVEVHNPYHD